MRFINPILSNFIGQLTTSMVEVYMYINIYMHIHVYMHNYIHTQSNTCTHTCTCIIVYISIEY